MVVVADAATASATTTTASPAATTTLSLNHISKLIHMVGRRKLEIVCIDLHQTGSVGKRSDRLQLIKFWPSCAPGKGSAAGRNVLAPPYYSQRAVFASLCALFHFLCLSLYIFIVFFKYIFYYESP